jgi:hypothetical protein
MNESTKAEEDNVELETFEDKSSKNTTIRQPKRIDTCIVPFLLITPSDLIYFSEDIQPKL